jgi:peptide/nickel transport system permease protein
MMWWRFLRHRLAVVSGIFLLVLYASILVCEFLAPYGTETRDHKASYAPPQALHLFDQGEFIGPFVYGYDFKRNETTLKPEYSANPAKVERLRFFCEGEKYRFWGLFEGRLHLFCPAENTNLHILGTDKLGHDLLSRLIYGARISLTIGLFGVTMSFLLGIVIGGVAGYYGGWVDNLIQRVIEVLRSLPHLPLWLALAAILPKTGAPLVVYFGITIILALLDWTGLARAVRSKLLSLREEEFLRAAQLMGARPSRIICRHLLPSFMSHLIASATLSCQAMILGETSLSYLGLGLRRPIVSWGVLLNNAQDVDNRRVVSLAHGARDNP